MPKDGSSETALLRVVELLRSAKQVMVLSGAGMSTTAGIPDFRSPNGLYANTSKLLDKFTYLSGDARKTPAWQRIQLEDSMINALTLNLFSVNPLPYHEMRRGMIIGLGEGQWKPTIGHVFPGILNRNKKLRMVASQNIDGLDHMIISDKEKLFNPHGLMSVLVSEPMDTPLCREPSHPIYQRYVELVKSNVKDIYADMPARKGKSSHLWPGPEASTPITLEMFGDLVPASFEAAREKESANGTYSVKPASVLFDRTLWRETAAGTSYDAFSDVENCDVLLIMGTSLSGLTIDNLAHIAGRKSKPRIVFDMTTKPVDALTWFPDRDCFMQGSIDKNILDILRLLEWLDQLLDFLPVLCLNSLRLFKQFVEQEMKGSAIAESMDRIDLAIEQELERERRFYEDE
jgi:NAD-dependent SIR2 family protein deacetylase